MISKKTYTTTTLASSKLIYGANNSSVIGKLIYTKPF